MQTINVRNRRQSVRRAARRSIQVECRKGLCGMGKNIAGAVLDLSDTGIRLIVTQELTKDDELEIIISGYGLTKSIKRLGNVRWQVVLQDGGFCIGLEFQKRLPFRDWQNLISAH